MKLFDLSELDLTSDTAIEKYRAEAEAELDRMLENMADEFMRDVIAQAGEALNAPVLLAAGRYRNPFAFTNIMSLWYKAIRKLARMLFNAENVVDVLSESALPSQAYGDVRDVLLQAKREEWTEYRTKRHLSRILIPKMSSGRWDSRAAYRAFIERTARTLVTENMGRLMNKRLEREGYSGKEWVSRHDLRVRHDHNAADGQVVPVGSTFVVGGVPMRYPADRLAPIDQTANCRCVIRGKELSDMGTVTAAATQTVEVDTEQVESGPVMWTGIIGMEQTLTGDGRYIESEALRWETPIPLRYVPSDVGAHDGAQVVGTIQHIERGDGGEIRATGTFDTDSEVGIEAARQVREGLTRGVSMDLDDVSFEVRVAEELVQGEAALDGGEEATPPGEEATGEARAVVDGKVVMMEMNSDDEVHATTSARVRAATIVAIPAFAEATISVVDEDEDDDDEKTDEEIIAEVAEDEAERADEEPDDEEDEDSEEFNWVDDVGGLPKYIREIADSLMERGFTESRAIATAVNTVRRWARGGPARAGGEGSVTAKTQAKAVKALAEWEAKKARAKAASAVSVTASGGSEAPPAGWFMSPGLDEPTPITVTEDGRVYGHLATWDSCHIAHADFCTSPPRSQTDYAYFHTGAILTDDGRELAVGHLTLNTSHAKAKATPAATMAHYENTGLVAADVRAGEDSHGIWVAGAVRPTVAADDVRALRAAPLSGDWRRIKGNLELVAALAVNVPGFPIPRPKGLVASGNIQSLVASGMVPPKKVKKPGTEGALSMDDLKYLKSLARREKKNRADALARTIKEQKVAAMAARIGGGQ